ncbi:NAD-dependent epimerase/dehydratase family protein [Clostridium ljungdahlii]|uniref:dTDP-L-rhamnose 4-epimerase n=1 Tax=Clostridium ljungdahlii TaxID=1538 RepID=A0A168NVL2_9CLOT|nr:NAD-dependent epimerase/dehydratase family protein [Clostridium ljungdahlii]OAA86965.1 dTDP-L-rhamnose 4-epimerase [Clostridium ljungdahlii]
MKKVLVTGGAGFIGTEIVKQLDKIGEYEITVLDALTSQIHGEYAEESYLFKMIKNKCRFIKADIRDLSSVKYAIADNEYIIHLASETGTGQSMYMVNQYNDVNVMGTSNLLQAILSLGNKSSVKKIVLSSSRSIYGEGKYECCNCGIVYPRSRKKDKMENGDFNMYCPKCGSKLKVVSTTEDSEVIPHSLYAFTKYAQEKMIETMCPAAGLEYTIFRFQNVYGVGQSLKNPYTGILSIFSSLLLENKNINIFEDGQESRDFVNVIDVASAVISSLDNLKSNNEIINIGSGKAISVLDIANKLKKFYKSNSKINITGDFRIGDIAHNFADIQKAVSILDYKQTVNLDKGLNDFCNWVLKQNTDTSGYEKSLVEMEATGMLIRKN